jgi:hypothetical protein
MALRLDVWLPCASFFSAGRIGAGFLALLMQLSIVLWPLAAKWARGTQNQSNIERMLAELAEAHRVPVDPYAAVPMKRFRQAA